MTSLRIRLFLVLTPVFILLLHSMELVSTAATTTTLIQHHDYPVNLETLNSMVKLEQHEMNIKGIEATKMKMETTTETMAATFLQQPWNRLLFFNRIAIPLAPIRTTIITLPPQQEQQQLQQTSFNGIKIYGDGTEYKFPPFLEYFVQRIQSYFSVYNNYEDQSRPVFHAPTKRPSSIG